MKNEVIEVKTELMSVSSSDVEMLGQHLNNIKSFVKESLKEGINSDFAKIPGTPKKCLLKPGAEKLMRLFGLSSRVECVDKVVSPEENLVMFTYKATVFHIKSNTPIAECEGVCNNHEFKYKNQNPMNILNTLMKMAQKRAIVGAVIIATGASDYFTQDEDEINIQKNNKTVNNNKFSGETQNSNGEFLITFGKFKNKKLNEVDPKDLENYCKWLKDNNPNPDDKTNALLDQARAFLRAA